MTGDEDDLAAKRDAGDGAETDAGAGGDAAVAADGAAARPSYLNSAALLVGIWVASFLLAAVLVNAGMLAASGRWLKPSDPVPEGFRLVQFPVAEEGQVQDLPPTQDDGAPAIDADATDSASASVMMPSPDLLAWPERIGAQLRAAVPTQPVADSPSPPALEAAARERHFIWQVKEDREGIQYVLVSRHVGPVESVSRYTVAPNGVATAIYYGEANHPVLLQYTVIHALWISLLVVSILAFWLARRAQRPPAAPAAADAANVPADADAPRA